MLLIRLIETLLHRGESSDLQQQLIGKTENRMILNTIQVNLHNKRSTHVLLGSICWWVRITRNKGYRVSDPFEKGTTNNGKAVAAYSPYAEHPFHHLSCACAKIMSNKTGPRCFILRGRPSDELGRQNKTSTVWWNRPTKQKKSLTHEGENYSGDV